MSQGQEGLNHNCPMALKQSAGLPQSVWVDPACGDGLCEAPFEFASYGHFGCRADCGRLSEVQNLTAIRLDLYWDFDHPLTSLPATVRSRGRCKAAAPAVLYYFGGGGGEPALMHSMHLPALLHDRPFMPHSPPSCRS